MPVLSGRAGEGLLFVDATLQDDVQTLIQKALQLRISPLKTDEAIVELLKSAYQGIQRYGVPAAAKDAVQRMSAAIEAVKTTGIINAGRCGLDAVVELYTKQSSVYEILNRRLRSIDSIDEMTPDCVERAVRQACGDLADYALALIEALRALPPPDEKGSEIWRGVRLPAEVYRRIRQNPKRMVGFPAFCSFSTERAIAEGFPGGGPPAPGQIDVLFRLQAWDRPWVKRSASAEMQRESEVILHPFSVMQISGVDETGRRPVVSLIDLRYVAMLRDPPQIADAGIRFGRRWSEHVRVACFAFQFYP
jgi:hypothetical protein